MIVCYSNNLISKYVKWLSWYTSNIWFYNLFLFLDMIGDVDVEFSTTEKGRTTFAWQASS